MSTINIKNFQGLNNTLILYSLSIWWQGQLVYNIFTTGMHTRRNTWLTWSCIFSSMWLQSPVVDSLWFLVTVPALHLSGIEAQLLPTMSHGYDNTTDMVPFWAVMTAHCVRIVHCNTCSYQHDILIPSDPLWAKLWKCVKLLNWGHHMPFKTDMQSPWLNRLMNKDNQYNTNRQNRSHSLSTNGCRLSNSKFPIQDRWCWQHMAKLYLQTLARNASSGICKWELLQPVIQNKNHIVLPAAVNINSPRSSDCHW